MEDAHSKEVNEVIAHFDVDAEQGLTDQQVHQAQAIYGRNELAPDEGTPLWRLIVKQFDDLLVKILIVAAVVDFCIAVLSGETGVAAFVEPGVIFLILLANATVGVITETKAEKAIEMLKAYEAENATVLRHGHITLLPAAELVPGDVVEVTVGCKIPADCRVVELLTQNFRVDQSILTGESNSVDKGIDAVESARKAVYQDMTCILFSGTVVTAGRCRAIVVGTGQSTAIGKIRDAMVEAAEEMTPLKRKLDEFGTFLSKVIAIICVLVWVINIRHFNDPMHGGWVMGALYYFKIAVALAVAAIPEGLPAVVTTCLALGTRKMAQRNAIVRSLPSVETLGCTTVICSDKTGTLTTNRMAVARVAVIGSKSKGVDEYTVTSGSTFSPVGQIVDIGGTVVSRPADLPCFVNIARCCSLCNDSVIYYETKINGYQSVGEATEVALRILSEKIGLAGMDTPVPTPLAVMAAQDKELHCNKYWQSDYPRSAVLEFSRARKMMSTLNMSKGQSFMFIKGAPENVLNRCKDVLVNDGSGAAPLTEQRRADLLGMVERYGRLNALRCLGLAMKMVPHGKTEIGAEDENDLTFLGIVAMHDPPRSEIAAAMEVCRQAGIRVIVVTGDNLSTAEAVCRQIGVLEGMGEKRAFTGVEFEELDSVAQAEAAADMCVFARVEPSHKSKLIELLKAQGEIVAMTGDGVNDAPALKKADIGVAMGSGTAVAKHAADMVLADDNFATIVSAVEEGRAIYNNTKQFIRYMVSSNIGEVVAIFFAALVGMPETLNPVQLLWVNLVTDGLPATALGFNKPDANIMRVKPRRKEEGIVDRWLFIRYMVIGTYVGCVTISGFAWWYMWFEDGPQLSWKELTSFNNCQEGAHRYSCAIFADHRPSTVSMSVLVVVEMFNALNALSENASLLQLPPWSNHWLLGAIGLSMLLHTIILYVPWCATLFSVAPLSSAEWWAIVYLSFPVILVDEVLKLISRNVVNKRWGSGGRTGAFSLLKKNSNLYEGIPTKDEV